MSYTCCVEHDRLYREGSLVGVPAAAVALPARLFDWLLEQIGQQQWLRLDVIGRVPVLKAQQYAGVLRSPLGDVLEILPKTGRGGQTPEQARQVLLNMLAQWPDFPHIARGAAQVAQADVPLLEVFMGAALAQFSQLMQRGISRQYLTQQGNLPVLRGKLQIAEQLKHNIAHHERFCTEHDEYVRNRAENRLIRAALRCILQWARHAAHTQHAQALDQRMQDIPPSTQIAQDWRQVRPDRNMQHYQAALAWAKIILDANKPLAGAGQTHALSLLFDLNRLFEKTVEVSMRRQLPQGHRLIAQANQQTVVRHHLSGQTERQLRPDLLYQVDGRNQAVLDAKWKILSAASIAQVGKDDLHQMALYAAAYLPQGGTVYVIYPQTPHFQTPLSGWRFQHVASGQVELCLLPFCLEQCRVVDTLRLTGLQSSG